MPPAGRWRICPRGHAGNVYTVTWSPDSRRVASASADRTIKVWDAATGTETLTIASHALEVNCVAWSLDGRRLASASGDQTIMIFDADSGRQLLKLIGHTTRVNFVAWNPDGERLASVSEDHTVKIWNTATGKETLTVGGRADMTDCLAWSPDGMTLASGGTEPSILLRDATAGFVSTRSPRYLPVLDRRLAADPADAASLRLRGQIHVMMNRFDLAAQDCCRYQYNSDASRG